VSNKAMTPPRLYRGVDRRVQRTRVALARALMELAPQYGFDALEVRELTARAGVGRSTFYKHYADKDDFLVSSFGGMVTAMDGHARRRSDYDTFLPAREVFAHVADAREFARSLVTSGQYARTQAGREEKLRALAEANLNALRPGLTITERREIAVLLAGAFASLMRWWIETGLRQPHAHIAELYESLARRAVPQA